MRCILAILFIGLYTLQALFLGDLFPGYMEQGNAHIWDKWYYARAQIYEMLFLIALLLPFSKSKAIGNAFLVAAIGLIFFSAFDKWVFVQFHYQDGDYLSFLFSALSAIVFYYHNQIKTRKRKNYGKQLENYR